MRLEDLNGQIRSVELFAAVRLFNKIVIAGRSDGADVDAVLSRFNCSVSGFEAFYNSWTNEIDLYDKRKYYKVVQSFKY